MIELQSQTPNKYKKKKKIQVNHQIRSNNTIIVGSVMSYYVFIVQV
jgi:hypothetical protein